MYHSYEVLVVFFFSHKLAVGVCVGMVLSCYPVFRDTCIMPSIAEADLCRNIELCLKLSDFPACCLKTCVRFY